LDDSGTANINAGSARTRSIATIIRAGTNYNTHVYTCAFACCRADTRTYRTD
jgi:hypothetical protein